MSHLSNIDEGTFEPSEELRRAHVLKSRVGDVGIYLDEYEIRDRIEAYLDSHDVELWEACKKVEEAVLSEHNRSVTDIPRAKREMFGWEEYSDSPRFDDSFSGGYIPHEEEELRRESINQTEQELIDDSHNTRTESTIKATGGEIEKRAVQQPESRSTDDSDGELKITECRKIGLPFLTDTPYHIKKALNHEPSVEGVKEATFDLLDVLFEIGLFILLLGIVGLAITACLMGVLYLLSLGL